MKRLSLFLGLAGFACLMAAGGCATTPKSDLNALQGKWVGREFGQNSEGTREIIITGTKLEFHGANDNDWAKGSFLPPLVTN